MILLTTHKNHILGYGFISDALGETILGVPRSQAEKYLSQGYQLISEFVEDPDIPKHEVIHREVPYHAIPKGELNVWAFIPDKAPIRQQER